MRVRCPSCAAPYFLPSEIPADGARCPNCNAPAPPENQRPKARAEPVEEPAGRSRVVGVVAILHLLVAAGGLCMFVGMAAVIGERGIDPVSAKRVEFGAGWAMLWAATGVGLLLRWKPAWYGSLALTSISLLALVVANREPLGAICNGLMCVGILWVLIARHREFH